MLYVMAIQHCYVDTKLVYSIFRHFLTIMVIWEQFHLSPSSCLCYAPTLNSCLKSCEAHHTALVAGFAAGGTLASYRCSLTNMQLCSASTEAPNAFLAEPQNRTEHEALAERYYAYCCLLWHLIVLT